MKHKPHIHDYCFFKPHKRMDSSYVVNENTQDFFLQLGLTLQEKRQKEGLLCEDISRALKIRRCYVQAIEKGDLSELPGSIYTKSFIKNYMRLLHLDKIEAYTLLDSKLCDLDNENNIQLFKTEISDAKPSWKELCLSVVFLLVGYIVWISISSQEKNYVFLQNSPETYSLRSVNFPVSTDLLDSFLLTHKPIKPLHLAKTQAEAH